MGSVEDQYARAVAVSMWESGGASAETMVVCVVLLRSGWLDLNSSKIFYLNWCLQMHGFIFVGRDDSVCGVLKGEVVKLSFWLFRQKLNFCRRDDGMMDVLFT